MKQHLVLGLLPFFFFPGHVLACDAGEVVPRAAKSAPSYWCARPISAPVQATVSPAPLDLTPMLKSGEFRRDITAMRLIGMRLDYMNGYAWDKGRGVVGAYRLAGMLRERFGDRIEVRVVGYGQAATMDFRSNRVTVWTAKGGIIIDIAGG